jgi:hypothetical protein
VLQRDYNRRPNERRKYVNIFAGLDNSNPMDFDTLKKTTFQNIFSCKNPKAISMKKSLNFINYSNERNDIISKKERNNAYDDYYKYCLEYETMKAPFFDHDLNNYMTKKRQKATLDK